MATAFLGPHPLCASLFTPGLKGLCDPRVDEGRDGYVGFNSFLAEQMRTSIPKVTNGVMKVALNSFLRMAHILRMMKASAMNRCGWPRARGSEFDGPSMRIHLCDDREVRKGGGVDR